MASGPARRGTVEDEAWTLVQEWLVEPFDAPTLAVETLARRIAARLRTGRGQAPAPRPASEGLPRAVAGTCPACGVAFVTEPRFRAGTEAVLAAHARICPGGERTGETVDPFAAVAGGR